jgi:hypothetical protein
MFALADCSSDDQPSPPQAFIDATVGGPSAVCQDAAATRSSLEDWVTSITFLDDVGYRQSYQETRTNLDNLAKSASGTGQEGQVETLTNDVVRLQQALARPQLVGTGPPVRAQIGQIEDDLTAIENTAGCPG